MNFEQWLEARGFTLADLTDKQKETMQAQFDAEQTPPKDEPPAKPKKIKAKKGGVDPTEDDDEPEADDPVQLLRASSAAEIERIAAIRTVCGEQHGELQVKAIKEGWDVTKTELEVLRAGRASGPAIHTGGDKPTDGLHIEAAMCLTAGLPEEQVGKWYDEKVMNAALSRDIRGVGIVGLMYEVCAAAGVHVRPGRINDDFIRAAFRADHMLRASGGFSTISVSGTLGNVANKSLLASYLAVNTIYEKICAQTDATDFKVQSRYRLTDAGLFLEVGPDGELKSTSLSENAFTNQVKTFGRLIALTRQQIINDDLGAFLQIPRMLGRQAKLAIDTAVFTLLLSNPSSFFHANNKNLLTGAGSVLDIDGLTAAEQKFLDQTDSDGKPVLIMPKTLLVPTSLKVVAEQLMKETRVNQEPSGNKPKPANNPHAGKWNVEFSPYLNSQALAGSSATAWYLFADPADIAAMEVAFLRGSRTPVIESAETDFNTLGMQWRGYFDFGVAMQDPKGGVKNNGA